MRLALLLVRQVFRKVLERGARDGSGLLNKKKMTQESSFNSSCFQFVPVSVVPIITVEEQKK